MFLLKKNNYVLFSIFNILHQVHDLALDNANSLCNSLSLSVTLSLSLWLSRSLSLCDSLSLALSLWLSLARSLSVTLSRSLALCDSLSLSLARLKFFIQFWIYLINDIWYFTFIFCSNDTIGQAIDQRNHSIVLLYSNN